MANLTRRGFLAGASGLALAPLTGCGGTTAPPATNATTEGAKASSTQMKQMNGLPMDKARARRKAKQDSRS